MSMRTDYEREQRTVEVEIQETAAEMVRSGYAIGWDAIIKAREAVMKRRQEQVRPR